MAGVVLETLSNKKLIAFTVALFLLQAGFFLIGGLVSPMPYNTQHLISNICLDRKDSDKSAWLYPRGAGNCKKVDHINVPEIIQGNVTAEQIVFSFQFPNPRDGGELTMSSLQQNMVAVFDVNIEYEEQDHGIMSELHMDASLAGRYQLPDRSWTNWTEVARSHENRPLLCSPGEQRLKGYSMKCDIMPLFELGSILYDQYLINLRLPTSYEEKPVNSDLGHLFEISVFVIHQNGGFTVVWFSIKTFVFPIISLVLAWFVWRIAHLERKPNMLEQTLIALGLSICILNFPVDWFSLWLYTPFMVLYSDIRQGLFYSVLLCFWVIFAGEHMMDQLERNHIVYYWKHLSAVGFGCICLFVFEMCERGVQLVNPFYSIWATTTGKNLALSFIILAGIAGCVYFIYLLVMIIHVFRNIIAKKSALPSMSKPRRKFYMSLIYRFSFLMVFTLVCAAMTVVLFILGQVSEGWKWGDQRLQYTSAVQTGVYGMWNIYVFSLLILYAPSNKYIAVAADETSTEERVEFTTIPSEASVLTSFAQKASAD